MDHSVMSGGNNVYGHIIAPHGLHAILQVVKLIVGNGCASIYKSGFNGAETLRFMTSIADFESTPLENTDKHLLHGCIAGDSCDVLHFIESLSRFFHEAGISHSFEVYDGEGELMRSLPNEHMSPTK